MKKSQIINLAQYTPVAATETVQEGRPVKYGVDNLYPQYLETLVDTTTVHGSLCKRIAVRIAGKSLTGTAPSSQTIEELHEEIKRTTAIDFKVHGGFYLIVKYNPEKKPAEIIAKPFSEGRIYVNEAGKITHVGFSKNWKEPNKKRNKEIKFPVFNPESVIVKTPEGDQFAEPAQVYYYFSNVRSAEFYPKPDYHGSINNIETEREIAMFDINELKNGFFPSVIIDMEEVTPENPEDEITSDMISDRLTGAKNGSKVLTLTRTPGSKEATITAFQPNDAPERYEQKIKTTDQRLFIAHGVTSPLLFGVRDSGSGFGSNKDEMLLAEQLFSFHEIEPKAKVITDALAEIMKKCGIEAQYKIEPNTPISSDAAQVAPVVAVAEKKKIDLSAYGHDIDPDWIEIDCYEVDYDEEDKIELASVSTGTAKPNATSQQDKRIDETLYITRYRYGGETGPDTREFCVSMLNAGKLYRKEDVMKMGSDPVNPGWGPRGADTYSIWLYKGGGNCHHFWEKVVFVSAKGLGIDVNSPKAKEIAVEKAAAAGYKTRNQYKVSQRPIDMPYKGFLPPEAK